MSLPVFISRSSAVLSIVCVLALLPGVASAQKASSEEAAQANNPLASIQALDFQNLYTGELTGVNKASNQFMVRYAQPFEAFGGKWLMRATMPINTVPAFRADEDVVTGGGDFNAFAAYLFDVEDPAISFGFGPQLTAPTSSSGRTGSGRLSVGFANVLFDASNPVFQWGYLLTWQASVSGSLNSNSSKVNVGALQPSLFYQLGHGWYFRSSGISTYDFETHGYVVPVGFGLGKVVKIDGIVVNVFVESQYSVVRHGSRAQEWNIFLV
ncbi:MAG: hypothetical protein AB7E29_03800 [Xanthobacter sp.]